MPKIVLHKAHTPPFMNAGGSGNGTTERKIQSDVIDALIERLQSEGYEAVSYNGTEIPPDVSGDLFLAPHTNGVDNPQPRGYMITSPAKQTGHWKEESKDFISCLDSAMSKHTTIPARKNPDGTFKVTNDMDYYYGFQYTLGKMPCCLIEMGFLTNGTDSVQLQDTLRMANCLYAAIRDYFDLEIPTYDEWTWAVQKGIIPVGMQMSTPLTAHDVAKMLYKYKSLT